MWPFGLQTAAVKNVLLPLPWNTISMQNHRYLHPFRKFLPGNAMMKTEIDCIRWHKIPTKHSVNCSHRLQVNPQNKYVEPIIFQLKFLQTNVNRFLIPHALPFMPVGLRPVP